jgi:hypothetical protein
MSSYAPEVKTARSWKTVLIAKNSLCYHMTYSTRSRALETSHGQTRHYEHIIQTSHRNIAPNDMTLTSVPQHSHCTAQQGIGQPNTVILGQTHVILQVSCSIQISDGAICARFHESVSDMTLPTCPGTPAQADLI